MDQAKVHRNASPYLKAGWLTKLTFSWILPLLRVGYNKTLNHEDVHNILPDYATARLTDRMERAWLRQKQSGKTPSLLRTISAAFGKQYYIAGFLVFIEDASRLLKPILFVWIIDYFQPGSKVTQAEVYIYATILTLLVILESFTGPVIVHVFVKCGMQWKNATSGLVYRKITRLSSKARSSVSSGHVVDLISTDCEKLSWMIWFLHDVWRICFTPVFTAVVLYQLIGPSVFAGIGVVFGMLLMQGIGMPFVSKYIARAMEKTDERVHIVGQMINAIKFVKMSCWEFLFKKKIEDVRTKELKHIWDFRFLTSLMTEVSTFNQRTISAVVLLVFIATGGTLTASVVFPTLALLGIFTDTVLGEMPQGLRYWAEVRVSVKRIESFLLMEELEDVQQLMTGAHALNSIDGTPELEVYNVSANWSLDEDRQTLSDVTIRCEPGSLVVLAGGVGSGKSSLLQVILGELPITSGEVKRRGKVAYTAQTPWVFSGTLRQNIVFGEEFDAEWYYKVVKATNLEKDISNLPFGDKTLVGDNGLKLSGGQKARLALARAVYSQADIYLLDDPFSALDTHVGHSVMDKCIDGLLKDKIAVLATHQVHNLPADCHIVVFKDGKIEMQGSHQTLVDSGYNFGALNNDEEKEDVEATEQADADMKLLKKQTSYNAEEEEKVEVGQIDWKVFKDYLRSGANWFTIILFFIVCIMAQLAYNMGDWLLSVWTNLEMEQNATATNHTSSSTSYPHLTIQKCEALFIASLPILAFFIVGRLWMFLNMAIRAAKILHEKLLWRVLRSPMSFFDSTPSGQIVNRFSNDTSVIDNHLHKILLEFIQSFSVVAGNIVIIILVNPFLAVAAVPAFVLLLLIRMFYMKSQRHLSRLHSTSFSPALTHISNTMLGVPSIRAYNMVPTVCRQFEEHFDFAADIDYTMLEAFSWFQFGCDVVAGLFVICTVYLSIILAQHISPGQVGLTLSYTIPLIWYTETAVRVSSEAEIEMVKVERVLQYTRLPSERDLDTDPCDAPPYNWPDEGHIVFDHVSFGYSREEEFVLKSINLDVGSGEKVGLVGRTGAGKSSLVAALFRLNEPLGQLRIDGLVTSEMGLHGVRNAMAVIPQDPILLNDSVRKNLDPHGRVSDADIWQVLEKVQMKSEILSKFSGLDGTIEEGGGNFSCGQKQLLCLARVLLNKRKILILDEATANIDRRTEVLIQDLIWSEFPSVTVLTIAHRLETVMNYHKILVMDDGKIVEYDAPYNLLKKKGHFYRMVAQGGQDKLTKMSDIARLALVQRTTQIKT